MRAPRSGLPDWVVALLRWRLPDETGPFLLGDLEEAYRRRRRTDGRVPSFVWLLRQTAAAFLTPEASWVPHGGPSWSAGSVLDELRLAFRSARRHPLPTLFAIVALGIGLGFVTAAVSVAWGTVWTGLPFEDADELVHFERADPAAGQNSLAVTPHDFVDWRVRQRSFEELGAYVEAVALLPREDAPAERFTGVFISAASFELLGASAARGRTFLASDEEPGAPAVVLLSDATWRTRFGADPELVGSTILLNDRPTTVIGVMPTRFGFPIAEQFWLPLRIDLVSTVRGEGRLDVFGRLRDGVDLDLAREEFRGIGAALAAAYPDSNRGIEPVLRSFTEEYVGPEFTRTVLGLLLAAALVLLVCCADVANLLLIRGFHRRREMAVRTALGAGRARLARQLLAEAAAVTASGAALGALVAWAGIDWFNRAGSSAGVFALPHGSDSLFWWDVSLNGPTLAALVVVAGLTTLLAGWLPAARAGRVGVARVLREETGAASNRSIAVVHRTLVVGQVALTTGLSIAAGLAVMSLLNVSRVGDGLEIDRVMTGRADLPIGLSGVADARFPDHESQLRFATDLVRGLRAYPALTGGAVATDLPLTLPRFTSFEVQNDTEEAPDRQAGVVAVAGDYFGVFGVEPMEGRLLDDGDRAGGSPVVVVNHAFAELHLTQGPPVGSQIRVAGSDVEPWRTVVGVVPNLWRDARRPVRDAGVYLPIEQTGIGDPSSYLGWWGLRYQELALGHRGDGEAAAEAMRGALVELDPGVPLTVSRTMRARLDRSLGRFHVWAQFYLAFAVAALFLAGLGVYGVMAFVVAQRAPEIGIRRALGASSASVQRSVLGGSLSRVGMALPLGALLGWWLSRGLDRVLYEVDAAAPGLYAAAIVVVLALALLGAWVPSLRAGRVDPMQALRLD